MNSNRGRRCLSSTSLASLKRGLEGSLITQAPSWALDLGVDGVAHCLLRTVTPGSFAVAPGSGAVPVGSSACPSPGAVMGRVTVGTAATSRDVSTQRGGGRPPRGAAVREPSSMSKCYGARNPSLDGDGGLDCTRESLAVGGRCGRGFDYKGRKSFSRPPGEVWELRVPVSPLRLPGPQPGV